MTVLTRRSLLAVLLIALTGTLPGCNAYMLQGKVVRGDVSDVQLVYAGDERLNAPGAENVEVRISRDADTLNRHLVGRTRTDASGVFTIVMDEFGTGWMQEKWLIEAVGPGFQNAALDMELPSKNTKWRLLITLAPGVSQPVQDEDLMQDIERFK
jgi:hypothetical protein